MPRVSSPNSKKRSPSYAKRFSSESQHSTPKNDSAAEDSVAEELGDLLFTVVNLSRRLGVDPELALRHTNQKFRHRFSAMEKASDRPLEQQSPEQLEALWDEAKVRNCPKIETALQVEAGN